MGTNSSSLPPMTMTSLTGFLSDLLATPLALIVASLSFVAAAAGEAQTPPTFHSGIELVQVNVVVLDRQRRPVQGLSASDFILEIDGGTVPIAAFSEVALPPPTASEANDLSLRGRSDVSLLEGRLVTILLDRSIPAGAATTVARTIAHSAIDALSPSDAAAVIRTSTFANDGAGSEFTSDKDVLRAAVESTFVGSTPDAPGALIIPSGECPCGLCSLNVVDAVGRAMAAVTDRPKLVLFVGSAISINDLSVGVREYPSCRGQVDQARDRVLRTLDEANVVFHVLDPRGLLTLSNEAALSAKQAAVVSPRMVRETEMQRQGDLAVLPTFTGGRTVLSTNTPDRLIPEIFAESASYYLLAIERPDRRTSGRLRVRVRGTGLEVRARTGYVPR